MPTVLLDPHQTVIVENLSDCFYCKQSLKRKKNATQYDINPPRRRVLMLRL